MNQPNSVLMLKQQAVRFLTENKLSDCIDAKNNPFWWLTFANLYYLFYTDKQKGGDKTIIN